MIIGVLKSLGLLDDQGKPTQRYYAFLDQTQSAAVLAEAIREAYADLFAVNINAQALSKNDLTNKFKTLSQGSLSESVLEKMATTFQSLVKLADFTAPPPRQRQDTVDELDDGFEEFEAANLDETAEEQPRPRRIRDRQGAGIGRSLGGLHYNIQIILPDSRDPQVYDALFRSLREHLFS